MPKVRPFYSPPSIARCKPPNSLTNIRYPGTAVNVHVVAVGKNPMNNQTGIKFYPEKLTAKAGDMVQFQFHAGNHTVTQSNFDRPCVPLSTSNSSAVGVYSSFQPAAASAAKGMIPVFTMMVNDTKPIWLFCSQGPHCQKGMVMVINENTQANASRSLDNYKKLAASAEQGNIEIPGGGSGNGGGNGNNGGNGGSGNNGGGGSNTTPGGVGASPTGTQSPSTSAPITAGASPSFHVSTTLLLIGAAFMLL